MANMEVVAYTEFNEISSLRHFYTPQAISNLAEFVQN